MLRFVAIGLILLPCLSAHAQQQERTLEDRIMKPNMTLENEAQNKQFTADRTSVNKRANVNTFYLQQKSTSKRFSGTRDFSSRKVDASTFKQSDGTGPANLSSKKAAASTYSQASTSAEVKPAYVGNKAQPSAEYSGKRPYLEQGKSQKSLNRKNKPMTIDQVRELLNKNK